MNQTFFRLRYQRQGGHTHVRVFAGPSATSGGLCGNLVMRNEEWEDFKRELVRATHVSILPDVGELVKDV